MFFFSTEETIYSTLLCASASKTLVHWLALPIVLNYGKSHKLSTAQILKPDYCVDDSGKTTILNRRAVSELGPFVAGLDSRQFPFGGSHTSTLSLIRIISPSLLWLLSSSTDLVEIWYDIYIIMYFLSESFRNPCPR